MREGLCDSNPVTATNNPAMGLPSRDRVLTNDELRIVWAACGDDAASRIIKLLVLTLCRRDEIGRLRWDEIDFERSQITIAASRYKSRRAHVVPLSTPALELLRAIPRRPDSEFVFSGGTGGYSGWSNATKALRSRMMRPVSFTLHDLRRSGATHLADLGTPPHVIESLLGHSNGSKVAATYNRSTYAREKAAALAMWADHVLTIVEGRKSKVVPLRTA